MHGRPLFLSVLMAVLMPVALAAQYPVRDGSVTNMEP